MTPKRLIFLCIATVITLLWWVSRPAPMGLEVSQTETKKTGAALIEDEALENEPAREPSSVTALEEKNQNQRRPFVFTPDANKDLHSAIRRLREKNSAQAHTRDYKDFSEVVALRATPERSFSQSMGVPVKSQAGYSIYSVGGAQSSLSAFDGTHLPVVTDKKSRLGIVNGNIFVAFNQYPSDVAQFAAENDLAVLRELPKIKTIAFKPRRYPAQLTDLVAQVKTQPNVKSADLEIVFRTPGVQ